jgi:hypothetical protein
MLNDDSVSICYSRTGDAAHHCTISDMSTPRANLPFQAATNAGKMQSVILAFVARST